MVRYKCNIKHIYIYYTFLYIYIYYIGYINGHAKLKNEIILMKKLNRKVELESLYENGVNFFYQKFLPYKLSRHDYIDT